MTHGTKLEWCWEGPWAGLARPPCRSGVDLLGEKRDPNQRPPLLWTQALSSGLECSELEGAAVEGDCRVGHAWEC